MMSKLRPSAKGGKMRKASDFDKAWRSMFGLATVITTAEARLLLGRLGMPPIQVEQRARYSFSELKQLFKEVTK